MGARTDDLVFPERKNTHFYNRQSWQNASKVNRRSKVTPVNAFNSL
jgi:hypothetical protein